MKNTLTLIALSLVVSLANAVNITVDNFHGLNTAASTNDLAVTKSQDGITLKFGAGTSGQARDAYGSGSSTFGQSGSFFDGSYVKFGNSGNQMLLDFRITNNTGVDQKLTHLNFDIRRASGQTNPTSYNLLYLATGDSVLASGSASGSEFANLKGIGSATINSGVNIFSNSIGGAVDGTAWIADGGYANIRLKLNGTASAQLDNFEAVLVPEPSTYALLSGLFVMAWIGLRRRSVK